MRKYVFLISACLALGGCATNTINPVTKDGVKYSGTYTSNLGFARTGENPGGAFITIIDGSTTTTIPATSVRTEGKDVILRGTHEGNIVELTGTACDK